jgi:hypothetical protein
MSDLRGQCRASSAPCPGIQHRQFHADAGDAKDGGTVVADQSARKADQDRCKGRPPRPLRYIPTGRGRGAPTDIRRNPVADRPTARTARASMSGPEAESDRRQQRESCVLMKAKPPTLTLAGRDHIASAANNVRLPTKRLPRSLNRQTMALLDPGIRGMSDERDR